MSVPTNTPQTPQAWHARKDVRIGAVAVVAVIAAVVIAIVLGNGGAKTTGSTSTTDPGVTPIYPVLLTQAELETRIRDLNQTVYWIGPVKGDNYELTRTTTNNVFIRYLPKDVPVNGEPGRHLVIGTYPYRDALNALKASGTGTPITLTSTPPGIAVVDTKTPTNVRVAFKGLDFQIDVYDPKAADALKYATSTDLVPVR
jgi:hypothetical protein